MGLDQGPILTIAAIHMETGVDIRERPELIRLARFLEEAIRSCARVAGMDQVMVVRGERSLMATVTAVREPAAAPPPSPPPPPPPPPVEYSI